MCALGLEQDLYISNKKKELVIILFKKQAKKLKQYKRMIDKLQNTFIVKPNKIFSSIKKLIYQYYLAFIYALSPQANTHLTKIGNLLYSLCKPIAKIVLLNLKNLPKPYLIHPFLRIEKTYL